MICISVLNSLNPIVAQQLELLYQNELSCESISNICNSLDWMNFQWCFITKNSSSLWRTSTNDAVPHLQLPIFLQWSETSTNLPLHQSVSKANHQWKNWLQFYCSFLFDHNIFWIVHLTFHGIETLSKKPAIETCLQTSSQLKYLFITSVYKKICRGIEGHFFVNHLSQLVFH